MSSSKPSGPLKYRVKGKAAAKFRAKRKKAARAAKLAELEAKARAEQTAG